MAARASRTFPRAGKQKALLNSKYRLLDSEETEILATQPTLNLPFHRVLLYIIVRNT